jgi:hypothetical protein
MSRSAATVSIRPQNPPGAQAPGIWRYPRGAAIPAASTAGYAIDATDGFVGTVGVARDEASGAYLIALGGPWNGGRSLMIPAGAISRVERDARIVHLACTRQQLQDAPAYENDRYQDAAFRGELGAYYEKLTSGSRLAGFAAALRGGSFGPAAAFGGRLAG